MKAAEQHVSGRADGLRERFSGLTVPWRRVALYVTIGLGFFLLGFGPMWLKAGSVAEQRDAAQREVHLTQLQNTLASAIIGAQRGEYEPSRQITSEFYTKLRSQLDAGNGSVFTATQREQLRPLLAGRDDLITLLARSDPAAAERLYSLYSSYLKISNT